MKKLKIAEIFDRLAEIIEFTNPQNAFFRVRALRQGAQTIRNYPGNIEDLSYDQLIKIPGIGKALAEKIIEYSQTGEVKELIEKNQEIPPGIFDLLRIPSLGPKKVKLLYDTLGISDVAELKLAINNNAIANLPGFGEKSVEKILRGIAIFSQVIFRHLRGEVLPVAQKIISQMKNENNLVEAIEIAGSLRRGLETVHDGDILACGKNPKKIIDYFCQLNNIKEIIAKGKTKAGILLENNMQFDLRVVPKKSWGSALQYFTGSKDHNIAIRKIAQKRNLKISEWGVFEIDQKNENEKYIAGKTEEEVYKKLNLSWIPPEIRENNGEIEMAQTGRLPRLIEQQNLNGDLHIHTNWSDGQNSIAEMVKQAIALNYQYIAITDHSISSHIANGLNIEKLKQQKKEIINIQKLFPQIKILWGTECDIKKDGSLDWDDEILKQFDIVIASIHSGFEQDNTSRLIKAIQNPFVKIIAHPTGRLFGHRNEYSLDFKKVCEACINFNTALEINSHYMRLDLNAQLCRQAKEIGVKMVINTDAHSIIEMSNMHFGITQGRRGWLENKDIINSYQLKDLLNYIGNFNLNNTIN